jgi:glycosyltransferase involved in cell wall biosynthesis
MISILIPIYNYNAFPCSELLHKQSESKVDFEILCQDDHSRLQENRKE